METVQFYTIKSTIRVQTLTALDDLAVVDKCACAIQECIQTEERRPFERTVTQKMQT